LYKAKTVTIETCQLGDLERWIEWFGRVKCEDNTDRIKMLYDYQGRWNYTGDSGLILKRI